MTAQPATDSPDLSLDFANTSGWRPSAGAGGPLESYGAALDWAGDEGILDQAQVLGLKQRAAADPAGAGEALERINALREAVYRVFVAAVHERAPEEADLELLNDELARASANLRLCEDGPAEDGGRRYAWIWTGMEQELTSMLWPVARAAAGLLTSAQLVRLRDCANESCGWLFIDHSKNASRRWCDMGECGNRAKARRFRERKRSEPVS